MEHGHGGRDVTVIFIAASRSTSLQIIPARESGSLAAGLAASQVNLRLARLGGSVLADARQLPSAPS
jgi:hypothetical protein